MRKRKDSLPMEKKYCKCSKRGYSWITCSLTLRDDRILRGHKTELILKFKFAEYFEVLDAEFFWCLPTCIKWNLILHATLSNLRNSLGMSFHTHSFPFFFWFITTYLLQRHLKKYEISTSIFVIMCGKESQNCSFPVFPGENIKLIKTD